MKKIIKRVLIGIFWLLLAVITWVASLWYGWMPVDTDRAWTMTGPEVPELKVYDDAIEEFMKAREISAGSLAIIKNGKLLYARGYSWSRDPEIMVQPDTLFRIASLTKPITATAILSLVEKGNVDLEAPFLLYLPEKYKDIPLADERIREITVEQLLRHRSGWGSAELRAAGSANQIQDAMATQGPLSREDVVRYFLGSSSLAYEPGSSEEYSNVGYRMLTEIVEEQSGMAYEKYIQELLSSIGINNIYLYQENLLPNQASLEWDTLSSIIALLFDVSLPDNDEAAGDGGLVTSTTSLAKFVESNTKTSKQPILSSEYVDRMFSHPDGKSETKGHFYRGLGWNVRVSSNDSLTFWHLGYTPGGIGIVVHLDDGLTYACLFNKSGFPQYRYEDDLDAMLHRARTSIEKWPDRNLAIATGSENVTASE